MKLRLRILILSVMLSAVLLLAGPVPAASAFPDVPSNHSYHTAIQDLTNKNIIGGYTNGNFGPQDPVMRQQFAKMIVGTMGFPCSEADICPFGDVTPGGPSTLYPDNYVAVCALYNITKGKDATHFAPYDKITRAQVITMVARAAQNYTAGLASPDTAYAGWGLFYGWSDPNHGYNAQLAEFNGLLTGIQGTGSIATWVWQPATRGEVAQILWNLMNTPGLAG